MEVAGNKSCTTLFVKWPGVQERRRKIGQLGYHPHNKKGDRATIVSLSWACLEKYANAFKKYHAK